MRPPPAAELLNLVDRAAALAPPRRALAVLEAALLGAAPDALARLPVGRRDELLLQVREVLFGSEFEATARCPRCADRLEVLFDTGDVRRPPPDGAPGCVRVGADEVRFRLPTGLDLVAVAGEPDPAARARLLWRRCVEWPGDEVPGAVRAAVGEAMRFADPQAAVAVPVECPGCGHAWAEPFDIAGFLWDELRAWAARTVREVHLLATAYGWTEGTVLALPAARRRRYLELVQA